MNKSSSPVPPADTHGADSIKTKDETEASVKNVNGKERFKVRYFQPVYSKMKCINFPFIF